MGQSPSTKNNFSTFKKKITKLSNKWHFFHFQFLHLFGSRHFFGFYFLCWLDPKNQNKKKLFRGSTPHPNQKKNVNEKSLRKNVFVFVYPTKITLKITNFISKHITNDKKQFYLNEILIKLHFISVFVQYFYSFLRIFSFNKFCIRNAIHQTMENFSMQIAVLEKFCYLVNFLF